MHYGIVQVVNGSSGTFMRSEKLVLNIVRVGLEPSDEVRCICRLLGQCFDVLVEMSVQALR